jgi:hypothetical protein
MAKAKKKKAKPKKRASKYESKLVIIGTLDQVLKVSVPNKAAKR